MGKHSDAMREAMALRGFAARTQKAYLGWMRRLVKQSKRTADELSESEVRSFLLRLTDEKRSVSTINQAISAFAFFYGDVVPRDWRLVGYQRAPQRLPVTLSAEEVRRLLDAAPTLRQRAIMEVSYSGGLRRGANGQRTALVARARALLGPPAPPEPIVSTTEDWRALYQRLTGRDPERCAVCHVGRLRIAYALDPALAPSPRGP